MRKVWRLIVIFYILFRYGLDEMAVSYFPGRRLAVLYRCLFFWRNISVPPAARLRKALEELGPIFIKFGQMLSTRRDLLPTEIADELEKLQDRVTPFDPSLAIGQITRSLGAPPEKLFASFDRTPVASASVAQVHFATLHNGREVAVKVLRPEMQKRIGRDIELLYLFAALGEKFWRDGKRLRLTAVVHEFDKSLHDELDLMREAANYSQLRRNFAGSDKLIVPEIFWDYCSTDVIVMEKMTGIPISQTGQACRSRTRSEKAGQRRRGNFSDPSFQGCVFPCRYASRQYPDFRGTGDFRAVYRTGSGNRRHAGRFRQGISFQKFRRFFPA